VRPLLSDKSERSGSSHLTFILCYSIISVKVGDDMKNLIKLLVIIIAAAMLGGCSLVTDFAGTLFHGLMTPTWKELRKQGLELCEKTMTAVKDGDAAKLYDLFCVNNKNDKLRGGIDRFFESIGGKASSYGEITQMNYPIHFVRDSVDYAIMRFEVSDIDTGGNDLYSADVILCPYSYFDSKHKGLQYLAIYKGDELVCTTGSIIEYYEPQEMPTEFTPVDKEDIFSDPIVRDFGSCVLYSLDNNDKERFISLFAPDKRAAAEEKYAEISVLIDSGLKSYSRIDHDGLGKGCFKYDHYEEFSCNIDIYDILTNDGKMLEIKLYACLINLEEPTKEGISQFTISLVDNQINDKLGHNVISEIII